ncbi:hypothetical protein NL676_007283 [Syzygium grande]|nr:hypothetical protein NL676_007283 [Syzygium grande]
MGTLFKPIFSHARSFGILATAAMEDRIEETVLFGIFAGCRGVIATEFADLSKFIIDEVFWAIEIPTSLPKKGTIDTRPPKGKQEIPSIPDTTTTSIAAVFASPVSQDRRPSAAEPAAEREGEGGGRGAEEEEEERVEKSGAVEPNEPFEIVINGGRRVTTPSPAHASIPRSSQLDKQTQLRCEAAPAMMPQHRNGPDVGAQYAGLLVNLHHDIPDDAAARVSRDVLELRPCEDGVTELLHRVSGLLLEGFQPLSSLRRSNLNPACRLLFGGAIAPGGGPLCGAEMRACSQEDGVAPDLIRLYPTIRSLSSSLDPLTGIFVLKTKFWAIAIPTALPKKGTIDTRPPKEKQEIPSIPDTTTTSIAPSLPSPVNQDSRRRHGLLQNLVCCGCRRRRERGGGGRGGGEWRNQAAHNMLALVNLHHDIPDDAAARSHATYWS